MKKKLIKLIPLILASTLMVGCGGGEVITSSSEKTPEPPLSSEVSEDSKKESQEESEESIVEESSEESIIEESSEESIVEVSSEEVSSEEVSSETEEEKALREAKEAVEEFIAGVDLELYRGEEKEELQSLIASLSALKDNSTNPTQLLAALAGVEDYLANAKTKAEYEKEEEEARIKALADKKAELVAKVDVSNLNKYRKAEANIYQTEANELLEAIDEAETIEELNEISFETLDGLKTSLKGQAEYIIDELLDFYEPAKWDLVNEHVENWSHPSKGKIVTQGVDCVGYAITSNKYQGDFSAVVRTTSIASDSNDYGLLFGNMNPTGTGFDGYLLNFDYAPDHQYLQVWSFINGNGIEAATKYEYIGGWVYHEQYGQLKNEDVRVIYTGESLVLYNNDAYLKDGEDAFNVVVPLEHQGVYALEPGKPYGVGYFNWDGRDLNYTRIFELKEFISEEQVDSDLVLKEIWDQIKAEASSKLELYEEDEQNEINGLIKEVDDAYLEEHTYDAFLALVKQFGSKFSLIKTHEQKELERHADVATVILDNMYSGDTNKYTPSNSDLVNEHALSWTHVAGSNTIVTNADAGYIMDNEEHGDFTMTFTVNGIQEGNPYGGAGAFKALCFGCTMGDNEYFSGYAITLSQLGGDDWVQVHKLDKSTGIGTASSTFIGGVGMNPNNVKLKVTVKEGAFKLYLVNQDGSESLVTLINSGFANVNELPIADYAGKFAIISWGGESTFTLHEYRNL